MNSPLSRTITYIAFGLLGCTSVSSAEGQSQLWSEDIVAAQGKAEVESKDILVFVNHDVCFPIDRLFGEALTEEFLKLAGESFIFFRSDTTPPRNPSGMERAAYETKLRILARYGAAPWGVKMLDSKGVPYATVSSSLRTDNPEELLQRVIELQKTRLDRDAAFEKAKNLEGLEKAEALVVGLDAVGASLARRYYKPVLDELHDLDPKDHTQYFAIQKLARFATEISDYGYHDEDDLERTLAMIDNFIEENDLKGAALQRALYGKAHRLEHFKKFRRAGAIYEEILRIDSDSEPAQWAVSSKARLGLR